MKQSAKRLFSSVLALVMVCAAFIVFFNFVQPAYGEIESLKGELEAKTEQLNNQKDVAGRITKLVSVYEGSGDARLQAGLALPLSAMTSEALAQINGIALNNKLTAQTYNVAVQTELAAPTEETRRLPGERVEIVKPVSPVTFQVRLLGSYGDFKAFMKNLETNIRIFDVKSIAIQPAGQAKQDLYSYDIRFVAYYQQETK